MWWCRSCCDECDKTILWLELKRELGLLFKLMFICAIDWIGGCNVVLVANWCVRVIFSMCRICGDGDNDEDNDDRDARLYDVDMLSFVCLIIFDWSVDELSPLVLYKTQPSAFGLKLVLLLLKITVFSSQYEVSESVSIYTRTQRHEHISGHWARPGQKSCTRTRKKKERNKEQNVCHSTEGKNDKKETTERKRQRQRTTTILFIFYFLFVMVCFA